MRKFDHDAAIRMYQDGATLREVGVHFGVTTERVRQVIVRRGLTTRGCSAPRKMKTRPLPEAEIAAAYRAGATLQTLIRDYHTHLARIKGVLARAGVPLRPLGAHARGPKVDLPDAEIAARYRAGEDTTHLAVHYGVAGRTIMLRLHAMGVQMRPKGIAGRKAAQAARRAAIRGNE